MVQTACALLSLHPAWRIKAQGTHGGARRSKLIVGRLGRSVGQEKDTLIESIGVPHQEWRRKSSPVVAVVAAVVA